MFTLITPTADRDPFLERTYQLLKAQSRIDWQWWICDTSYRPSTRVATWNDSRVHYLFEEKALTIGEKRNRLIEASQGELIVQIDDDDYYAPTYLQQVASLIEGHDFLHLLSWFAFDLKNAEGYYWQTDQAAFHYYVVGPLVTSRIKEIRLTEQSPETLKQSFQTMGTNGYGFSYVYRRKVWEKTPFAPLDLKEDSLFFEAARKNSFSVRTHQDQEGILVKLIHDQNVSCIYPQYRIPKFLMKHYLPHFMEHLNAHYGHHD